MSKDLILICFVAVGMFGVVERVIHARVIYPYLKGRGIQPTLRWYVWFTSTDIAAYREARSSASEPLTWWYVIQGLRVLAGVIVASMLYSAWSK